MREDKRSNAIEATTTTVIKRHGVKGSGSAYYFESTLAAKFRGRLLFILIAEREGFGPGNGARDELDAPKRHLPGHLYFKAYRYHSPV